MARLAIEVGGRGGRAMASGEGEVVTRGEREEEGGEGEGRLAERGRGGDGRGGLWEDVGAGGEGDVFVGGEREEGFVWRNSWSEEGLEGGTLKGRWEFVGGGGEGREEGGEGRCCCWLREPLLELIMSVSSLLQALANSSRGDFSESFCKDFIFRRNNLSVVKCI